MTLQINVFQHFLANRPGVNSFLGGGGMNLWRLRRGPITKGGSQILQFWSPRSILDVLCHNVTFRKRQKSWERKNGPSLMNLSEKNKEWKSWSCSTQNAIRNNGTCPNACDGASPLRITLAHAKKTHVPADALFADTACMPTRIEIAHGPNSTVYDCSVDDSKFAIWSCRF